MLVPPAKKINECFNIFYSLNCEGIIELSENIKEIIDRKRLNKLLAMGMIDGWSYGEGGGVKISR